MAFAAPNIYLLAGKEGALIDSGHNDDTAISSTLDYASKFDRMRLAYVVVTHAHPDHIGGAKKIKRATGAEIVVHSLAIAKAKESRIKADRVVEDGDVLTVDNTSLRVIHTPGHSPGHVCILMEQKGILFSGDQVLGLGTTALNPPEGDMAEYIASLRKLLAYDIQLVCPGHGPPIRTPRRKLEELVQHRLEREQQVLSTLHTGRAAVAELVHRIYPELDSRLQQAAEGQILAHLIKLEREGKVVSLGSGAGGGYTLR